MNGSDHVRSTMRRGFRAYFAACMPTAQTTAMVEIATEHARRPAAQRRRRERRQQCQSPLALPDEPVKGFFYHFCEGNGLPDCVICFNAITSCQRVISLRCSDTVHHSFHEECIAPWLGEKGTCPVCRAEIV